MTRCCDVEHERLGPRDRAAARVADNLTDAGGFGGRKDERRQDHRRDEPQHRHRNYDLDERHTSHGGGSMAVRKHAGRI